MVELNINESVWVKILPAGLVAMEDDHAKIFDRKLQKRDPVYRFTPPKRDAEGWTKMQLWEVMRTFGPRMYMGSPNLPIETTIRFEASE